MRIVFMGTPEFAVASLEKLIEAGHEVCAVVTAPDRPAGRGQKLTLSAIKECAMKHGIEVLQPEKLKDETFLSELKSINAELFVVVAFRMLPEVVWNMPPKGTINLHGSLLPQYRGAAPINWAVINGEKETGVTTFFIRHEIDTGNILQQRKFEIGENEDAGSVHDRMMIIGAELLSETVSKIEKGEIHPVPQENLIAGRELKHAPKIFRDHCHVDWNHPASKIHDLVRGLSPYPTAYADLHQEGKETISVKIFATTIEKGNSSLPGKVQTDGKTYIHVQTKDDIIAIRSLQIPGKKRMEVEEFLRGNNLTADAVFK